MGVHTGVLHPANDLNVAGFLRLSIVSFARYCEGGVDRQLNIKVTNYIEISVWRSHLIAQSLHLPAP